MGGEYEHKIFKEHLSQDEVSKFLTFPDEVLILACRKHYAPLVLRLLEEIGFTIFIGFALSLISYLILHYVLFSLAVFASTLVIGSGALIRELVHWYLHLYIVTNKKILEVRYNPLLSELSNSVLLDQIRCTEIDAELHGFISEVLDLGNVSITFDRPTNQKEFILSGIRSPRKIANYLSSSLHSGQSNESEHVWYKEPLSRNGFVFTNSLPYGQPSN